MGVTIAVFISLIHGAIVLVTAGAAAGADRSPARTDEPVVLLGAQLEALDGLLPEDIVAFRYSGCWEQVPVQVDERKYVDFGIVYRCEPVGLGVVAYADPCTDVGSDGDPVYDEDDELVFMAADGASRAPMGAVPPAGLASATGVEIELTDPLGEDHAYVYLFQTDGTLTPDAGQDYVTYVFDLLAGDYLSDYNTEYGSNPEDSEASSACYRIHFSDRWVCDEANIYAGSASGVDILDRHKAMFGPGDCLRTEDTFSLGDGAFFANKDGPVRAIRSYLGANSGPFTQRDHLFYERRQDILTYLRVHVIPGVMDLYDYSPAASGMMYYNDWNLEGTPIDGWPDAIDTGPLLWEMTTGEQGSVIMTHSIETDIHPFSYTSFHSDDATPQYMQCTGDEFEYATSGVWVDHEIPNTDPQFAASNTLTARRIAFYGPPGQTPETALLRHEQVMFPLDVATRPYPRTLGDFDGDCRIDVVDYAAFRDCLCAPQQRMAGDCDVFDWDADCDIDLRDYAQFAAVFTGSAKRFGVWGAGMSRGDGLASSPRSLGQ